MDSNRKWWGWNKWWWRSEISDDEEDNEEKAEICTAKTLEPLNRCLDSKFKLL